MPVSRFRADTVLDVFLLLPARVFLLPLLVFGALGSAFAVPVLLVQTNLTLAQRLGAALLPLATMLWVLAAWLGMAAAWLAALEPEIAPTRRLRAALAAALIAGMLARWCGSTSWAHRESGTTCRRGRSGSPCWEDRWSSPCGG